MLQTYCPLKVMINRTKSAVGWGSFNNDEKCDKQLCGFWSVKSDMCGIAAIGSVNSDSLPQPEPLPEEQINALLNPEVTA